MKQTCFPVLYKIKEFCHSAGKTTVIQSIFAMLQNGKKPFRGEYMNIGKTGELQNAITGSREIVFHMCCELSGQIKNRTKKISQTQTIDSGDMIDKMKETIQLVITDKDSSCKHAICFVMKYGSHKSV